MRKFIVALICIVFVLSLCGCGAKPIVLSTGEYPQETISITAPVVPEDLPLLDGFPQLQSADFSGSSCYEEIVSWAAAHPQVNVSYTVALPDGKAVPHNVKSLDLSDMDSKQLDDCVPLLAYLPSVNSISLPKQLGSSQLQAFAEAVPEAELDYSLSVAGVTLSPDTTKLDLSSMDSAKFHTLLPWLSITKQIKEIELGTDGDGSVLSWDDISSLHTALPDAKLNYSFKLYDKDFSLSDTEMILRHIPIDDEGELVKKVSSCMPDLSYLDMDSCGVSNEAMAEIRDSLPNTDVVWRIWFGTGYSVRTDVERILASNPGRGGELTGENTACLKYCTKVKYLDLGHNNYLDDIGFTAYMPDLEVLIVAMGNWSDCSPLVNCPKIEYLEVQSSSLNDLRPLTGLKNLKHLNIAFCMAVTDISPLFEMTQLERLWIGCLTPVSPEQVEEFCSLVPDCKVNTTTLDPTEEGWRYIGEGIFGMELDPRYELLREQMCYGLGPAAYAYIGNDSYYYG